MISEADAEVLMKEERVTDNSHKFSRELGWPLVSFCFFLSLQSLESFGQQAIFFRKPSSF